MPTVLVKEFFRNFSGIFPEKFRASYFSGKVTTLNPTKATGLGIYKTWICLSPESSLSKLLSDWDLFLFIVKLWLCVLQRS